MAGDAADRDRPAADRRADAAAARPRRIIIPIPKSPRRPSPSGARKGAKALVTGFVQSRSDGRMTVGCYVYDVDKGRELARKGFVVAPSDWRRAAHKCSGLAYTAVTGAPGMFDTPHRLCRRERQRRRQGQAHRGDGQRRHQPSLSDRRRHDGPDPAPVAARRARSPTSASPAACRRSGCIDLASKQRAAAGGQRCDQLRAALFAGRNAGSPFR